MFHPIFHQYSFFLLSLLAGQVLHTDGDVIKVDFLHASALNGRFRRPPRPDVATVERKFVFMLMNVPPVPVSGGRMFNVAECTQLEDSYKLYKARYEQLTKIYIWHHSQNI